MNDLQRYRDWLIKARGKQNPSGEEVKQWKRKVERHRVYGSILDLFILIRRDTRGDYAGTRAYLAFQGLNNPSAEDLQYYHRKLRQALLRRGWIGVILAIIWLIIWLAYSRWLHLGPFG